MTKRCSKCKEFKPESEFFKNRSTSDGLCVYCKSCKRACDRKSRKKVYWRNKEKFRAKHLKYTYGITLEEYAAMLAQQDECCAICHTCKPGKGRQVFCVDHDHTTGKIRGLLCAACNSALGLLKDDPQLLRKAAKYLES